MNKAEVVGTLEFHRKKLDVYSSLDIPLFKASDVAELIDYSDNNISKMLEMCEYDETLTLPMVVSGQTHHVHFVNEHGLYSILSQSRKPIARKWRRVAHDQLIEMRRARNFDILQQFEEWDHAADSIYFDEETGIIMQSVTVVGGDVEQVIFTGELPKIQTL